MLTRSTDSLRRCPPSLASGEQPHDEAIPLSICCSPTRQRPHRLETLTLNKLTVDKTLIEVCVEEVDIDGVVLYAASAPRIENQDAIDASIVNMLADPKEARAGIKERHFLPFNPVEKRTATTYFDSSDKWHRSSKGVPEQIIELCNLKGEVEKKVHAMIDG